MYEHAIKRAGLSFNRILYSNTRAAQTAFTKSNPLRFRLTYMIKNFENGKELKRESKLNLHPSFLYSFFL